jgi:hypothetical protein
VAGSFGGFASVVAVIAVVSKTSAMVVRLARAVWFISGSPLLVGCGKRAPAWIARLSAS